MAAKVGKEEKVDTTGVVDMEATVARVGKVVRVVEVVSTTDMPFVKQSVNQLLFTILLNQCPTTGRTYICP